MSGPTVPRTITLPFASSALPANINVVPFAPASPGFASYTQGFPPENMKPIAAGGIAPKEQDFNGVFKDITSHIVWLESGQSYVFDAALSAAIGGYNSGAVLTRADGTGQWLCVVNGNTSNPDTGGAGWVPYENYGQTLVTLLASNVTLTTAQAARTAIVLSGALSASVQLILPAWTYNWLILNNTSGPFTVTAKTAAGTGSLLQQGPNLIWCDGTNIASARSASGVFTAHYVNGTTAPSGNCYWRITGNIVTIVLPNLSATSNSTSFSYSGLPTFLLPQTPAGQLQLSPIALAQDNGVYVPGAYAVVNNNAGIPSIQFVLLASAAGWSGFGIKSVLGTIVYDLNPGGQ